MANTPKKHTEEHPAHKVFEVDNAEGRMNWVFFDFWPIMYFVVYFLLMMAIPLTLSGMMHNPFSSADAVWPGYGLLLFAEFVLALIIFILAPYFVMPYLVIVTIYGLILAEQGRAWKVGFISDGTHTWMISMIAILFLTYVLAGWFVLFKADRNEKRRL